MKNAPILKISKLDAAKRQLETAIQLWFQDGDPVSIHTLVSAAYEVLSNVSKYRGNTPMLLTREGMSNRIVPGKEKEFFEKISKAKNFFKHADKDPDEVIDFRPGANEVFLWESCRKYRELSGENLTKLEAVDIWFMLNHPEIVELSPAQKEILLKSQGELLPGGKLTFFRDFMASKAQC